MSSASKERQQQNTRIGTPQLIFFLLLAAVPYFIPHPLTQKTLGTRDVQWPPNTVFVDPRSFAVLGTHGNFRQDGMSAPFFNPTNSTTPFFQAFDPEFLKVLGSDASIREVASTESYAFAHEAPVWSPETDEVFFASNAGMDGVSGLNHNNAVYKMNLSEIRDALKKTPKGAVNVTFTHVDISDEVQMTNGGTGPINGALLFTNEGRGTRPPNLVLVHPKPPYNITVLLDSFYGRQFISLNDVKVHPKSGHIFFTDVPYGFYQDFRPPPTLPNQVYRFDTRTHAVRVVADGFDKPNGIAFSPNGKVVYIADTGVVVGYYGVEHTLPATIYAFDLDPETDAFINRRVFAYVDTGIPDGIQVDMKGNVYAGCGEGVHVWNSRGTLLGKFFTGATTANMVFVGHGEMIALSQKKVFMVELAKGTRPQNLNVKIPL